MTAVKGLCSGREIGAIKNLGGGGMWLAFYLFMAGYLSLAGPDLGGWSVEKYQAEEHELVMDSNLYILSPPDNRGAIVIREVQAHLVLNGKLSPEQVYRDRNRSATESEQEFRAVAGQLKERDEVLTSQDETVEPQGKLAPINRGSFAANDAPTNPVSVPSVTTAVVFDPNGDQPWPYQWEEMKHSCEGSYGGARLRQVEVEKLKEAPSGAHPYCGQADAEEAARRLFYNYCNGFRGEKIETPFPGKLKAIQLSKLLLTIEEASEYLIFYARAECDDGRKYSGKFGFASGKGSANKCWLCNYNSGMEPYSHGSSERIPVLSTGLSTVDLQKPRRTSPQMSEFSAESIPGYWKSK